VALLIAAVGCGRQPTPPARSAAAVLAVPAAAPAPAPVKFLSAAEARPSLQVSLSISSLDRLLGAGTALVGRAVPLPLDAASVRDMLLSQAGLSPAIGENLDFSSPIGVAFVSMGPNDLGLVFSVAAKGAAEAQKVVSALGKEIGRRGEVVQIDNGSGGKGWIWRNGSLLVISDSFNALVKGAALATEARVPARDDVTAVLYPDAIAVGHGTDVKTALSQAVEMVRSTQAAQGMPMNSDSVAMMNEMVGLIADTSTVEFGLQVSTSQGMRLVGRMNAKPGSNLEKMARETRPLDIDPMIFTGGIQTPLLAAYSSGSLTHNHVARLHARLQAVKTKGAAAALAVLDAAVEASTGLISAAGFAKPQLGARLIFPLKDADSAAKLAAAMKRLDTDAGLALTRTVTEGEALPFIFGFKKEVVGKLAALHYTITPNTKVLPAPVRDAVQSMFGKAADIYLAVSGPRLIATGGKLAKADLQKLATGKPGEATGEIAPFIVAAKGRDLIEYLDLTPFISLGASLSKDPRAAAFAKAAQSPIPVIFTSGGDQSGKGLSFDVTLPPAAFSGAGTILQGMNGTRPR
jgi:hypothetical protein